MRTASVAFLISTLTAAALTPLIRQLAIKYGLLDHAHGSRKVHGKPIPRLGGVAIIIAFMAPLLALAFFETSVGQLIQENRTQAIALLIGGLAIGALGLYDDIKGAGAKQKFTVQFIVATAMYYAGYQVENIATPFSGPLSLGVFSMPLTVLWIVGVINALNLIDGLDGLAGGVAMFAIGTTFVIAFRRGDAILVMYMACLGGAVLGFLFYNFNPASIFMGDSGSMFLGLVLAVSSMQASQKASTTVAVLVPIIVLGFPIADTLVAMVRRAIQGRPIFAADREHIHHKLLGLGLSHRKAVLVLYAACILLAGTALLLSFANSVEAAILLLTLSFTFVVGMRLLGFMRISDAGGATLKRKRNRELRSMVRNLGQQLSSAKDAQGIWRVVRTVAEPLETSAVSLALSMIDPHGDRQTTQFSTDSDGGPEGLTSRFEVTGRHARNGELTFRWMDGRTEIIRDDEIAIEVLCDHIAAAWDRVCDRAPRPSERDSTDIRPN